MEKIKRNLKKLILFWNLFCMISYVDSAQIGTYVEIWHTMIELTENKKKK